MIWNKGKVLISDEALLADLRRVQAELGYINLDAYRANGAYSDCIVKRRFGTWLKACALAGLESRSDKGRHPVVLATEPRRCLGTGPDHLFQARKDDRTHRICDACKGRTAPDPWDRIAVADGWEVVGA